MKERESKSGQLAELEAPMATSGMSPEGMSQIERKLKIQLAGIKGEHKSTYDIVKIEVTRPRGTYPIS